MFYKSYNITHVVATILNYMYLYFFMKNRKITHNVKFDITIVFINAYDFLYVK